MPSRTLPNPDNRNTLTRRKALAGTASVACTVSALAVGGAAGMAMPRQACAAELPGDPGLAELEAGYERWHEMLMQAHALEDRANEARGRAWDRVPEVDNPEPVPDPDVAKLWHGPSGLLDEGREPTSYVTIPQDLLDRYDAFRAEWHRWWDRKPKLDANDPDFRLAQRLDRQNQAVWKRAERLRRKLLKVPTTSPRGLLLKLALATDTDRLEDFDRRFRRPYYYGTFDTAADLMPGLLADLRAMVGANAA